MKLVLKENDTKEFVAMWGKSYIKIDSPTSAEVFIYRPGKPPVIIGITAYENNKVTFENYDTNETIDLPWSGKLFTEDRV